MDEDTMGLGIKLVIFNDGYHTNIVKEITGFNNAREAAHYRDNSEYAALPSELQLDYNNYLEDSSISPSDDMRDLAVDDRKNMGAPRQVIRYHGKAGHFWASVRFYGLVSVLGGGAFFSFACLVGSILAGSR